MIDDPKNQNSRRSNSILAHSRFVTPFTSNSPILYNLHLPWKCGGNISIGNSSGTILKFHTVYMKTKGSITRLLFVEQNQIYPFCKWTAGNGFINVVPNLRRPMNDSTKVWDIFGDSIAVPRSSVISFRVENKMPWRLDFVCKLPCPI